MNGRLVRDIAELERLHSNDVKSIEVISNPSARYEASTKAVVRIFLRIRWVKD